MSTIQWTDCGQQYQEIRYHKAEGIAKITINRPHRRNAFTPLTVDEMRGALDEARMDTAIGVVILTGEGPEAFCSGGDQGVRGDAGYKHADAPPRLNVLDFQREIRACPKPVIAMVAGYAIGGGHVLHVICDLTLAADNGVFAPHSIPSLGVGTTHSASTKVFIKPSSRAWRRTLVVPGVIFSTTRE